ncbi:hypothetical protein GCM10009720_18040 [Yaniella flava]|uniref:Uncharacterized protein n=1 Tax=Yaniella flava TaxID=287930 RepID=A0ABN2UJT7_9MICC
MSTLTTFIDQISDDNAPFDRISITTDSNIPTLVTPVPAFAAIGFGMYTALNNCFG